MWYDEVAIIQEHIFVEFVDRAIPQVKLVNVDMPSVHCQDM